MLNFLCKLVNPFTVNPELTRPRRVFPLHRRVPRNNSS